MVFKTHSSMVFSEWPNELAEALRFLVPKAFPGSLGRYGGYGDGAYLVPENLLDQVEACFSPGVRNAKAFEDDLATRRGIRSHLLDASSDVDDFSTPLIETLQTFEKKWLAPTSSKEALTLHEWIERYEPNSKGKLMLQMDIEGAEWEVLGEAEEVTLRHFIIIVVELHKLDTIFTGPRFSSSQAATFSKLSANFTVVHAHPNNCCGVSPTLGGSKMRIPRTLELTLVRTDTLPESALESSLLNPELPHRLDIWRNVPGKPPLFLGDGWRQLPPSHSTLVRILVQKIHFELIWRWKRFIPRSIYSWYRGLKRWQKS